MQITIIILLFIISYLLGSIPGGYLITKLIKKDDIRNYGSKSTGATNTTRVLGFKLGLVAALIDILKGIVVISILYFLKLEQFYIIKSTNILAYYGISAVIGHIFPIYLKFNGGKAVATSLGVVLFLNPLIAIIGILAFILTAIISNYVSLSSMIGALLIFISALLTYLFDIKVLRFHINNLETVIAYFIFLIIIIIRHKSNIKRLINGNENKISELNKNK